MKLIPKYQNAGKLPIKGRTDINYYGDKKHYLPVFKDNNGDVNIGLPDIVITPRNNLNLTSAVNEGRSRIGKLGVEVLSMATPVGDVQSVYEIGKDVKSGNYGQAALGVGLMLLPNVVEKPLKRIGKLLKKNKKVVKELQLDDVKNWTDNDWDFNYNQAIKDNNTQKVQELRDLHFKAKAPNTKTPNTYYRHDSNNFNIFDSERFGRHGERIGKGIYFLTDKDAALNYGNKVRGFYVNSENLVNDIEGPKLFGKDILIEKFSNSKIPILKKAADNVKNADAVYGIDNSWGKPLDEYVVKESKQVKLANPITYDNNGKVIPISKRDNFNNSDIRYGLIPLLGFGAYKQYNNEK